MIETNHGGGGSAEHRTDDEQGGACGLYIRCDLSRVNTLSSHQSQCPGSDCIFSKGLKSHPHPLLLCS